MCGFEEMCALHAVIMLWVFGWQGLANRSMRIPDLYVGVFLIPRFIKNDHVRGGRGVGGGVGLGGVDVCREGEVGIFLIMTRVSGVLWVQIVFVWYLTLILVSCISFVYLCVVL